MNNDDHRSSSSRSGFRIASMAPMPTPASTSSAYGRRRHILDNTPNTSTIAPRTTAAVIAPRQPPSRTIWRTTTPPTLPPALLKKLSPLLTFTETTLLQSFFLTILTILLTSLLSRLTYLPAVLLNRCTTLPPTPSRPYTTLLLRFLTLPALSLTLATRHLLTRTHAATQAIGTTVAAILQSSLLRYAALGSLPPHHYLTAACTPSTSPLLPAWPDLLPQLLHAAIAAPLYYLLSRHATPPPTPFPHRSARRALALPAFPALLAAIPVMLIPVFTLFAGIPAFPRALGAALSAVVTTFATLVSWSLQTAIYDTPPPLARPEFERDRLSNILHTNAPSSIILPSLRVVTTSNLALHPFPGYTDATGTAWRALLAHCLHPLSAIRTALQNRPTRTLLAASAASRVPLPRHEVTHAIIACASLARVYEECANADTFGAVHRTLPYALAELLRCKVETAGFLEEGGVEWGERLRKLVGVCSTREMVAAVDDALSICVYRIVGAFRGHLGTYLTGGEVEWDRGLNGLLKAFLEYQLP